MQKNRAALSSFALLAVCTYLGCATGVSDDGGSGGVNTTTTSGTTTSGTTTSSTTTSTTTSSTTTSSTTTSSTTTSGNTTSSTSSGSGGQGGSIAGGDDCTTPADVSAVSFPVALAGQFDGDPAVGGSCDTTPTNAVWFAYAPVTSGFYRFDLVNNTLTVAYSRLAIFSGTGCSPLGTELTCVTETDTIISDEVFLAAGESYLILFHTDGDAYTMVDPELTITAIPTLPGEDCPVAEDVSAVSFPYSLPGTYSADPAVGGSCDTTPTNAVWYSYTPSATGYQQIDLVNHTLTNAYSRVAVFDGASCNPLGSELACATNAAKTVSTPVYFVQGQSYLIAFYTDGDSYTMVDPDITLTPIALDPGDACELAYDISAETFPFVESGQFDWDPPAGGGSCNAVPTNSVWWSYTPSASGFYRADVLNHTATSAYSRLAVFHGTGCSPHGPELVCASATAASASTTVYLAQGESFLFLFSTNGDAYTMVDPQIALTPATVNPGEACEAAYDISAASFPAQLTGTFDWDPQVGGSCDTTPNNAVWFDYSPPVSGLYQVDLVNHTATSAYSRVAVFEGAGCTPHGPELACVTNSAKTATTQVYFEQNKSYRILFYTDGDSFTMLDPEITLTAIAVGPGELCQNAVDLAGVVYPFQVSGQFDRDPPAAGSCDTTPNNAVWYVFTPATTASYTIALVNHTLTNAYSRVAVRTGTSCSPLGTEVGCNTSVSKNVSVTASLTQGQPYLIAFYTDGDSYTMIDPQITITP